MNSDMLSNRFLCYVESKSFSFCLQVECHFLPSTYSQLTLITWAGRDKRSQSSIQNSSFSIKELYVSILSVYLPVSSTQYLLVYS